MSDQQKLIAFLVFCAAGLVVAYALSRGQRDASPVDGDDGLRSVPDELEVTG